MKTHAIFSLLLSLVVAPLFAQETSQYAIYNYRNDGKFNAWLNVEIDSITFSCIDTLGIEHDDIVVQEVWTADSVYRIPMDAIDSIGFRAPEPKLRDNLFYIRDYHINHTISLDSLTVYFNKTISNDSLPSIGQVMLCAMEKSPFDEGFAGKVQKINRLTDRIEVVCSQVGPCDVFERLVMVGTAVSDLGDFESEMKGRRRIKSDEHAIGIEEIDLPDPWKDEWEVKFLDLLSITSKKPTVRYKYYMNISSFYFYISGDIWITHSDLTYNVTFDWEKIMKLGKEYDNVKQIWSLFKDGNYSAIQKADMEKALENDQWEKKIPIPFQAGPFNIVFELGAMLKPQAVDLKAEWEMKSSAFHHIGFYLQGHNPLAPDIEGFTDGWEMDQSNTWTSFPCTSYSADIKIDGSLAFGLFARLNVSMLTKYLVRASIGAEAGIKVSYSGDFTLKDSDCNVPNIYGLLKDTNVGVKCYGKVKGEFGALPFNLINLQAEAEYPFFEGKFYLFPHFTEPSLTTKLGFSRSDNELFCSTVSGNLIPFYSCYPGLGFYSDSGDSEWNNQKAVHIEKDPYNFESFYYGNDEIEYSAYEAKLNKGETYRCYPVFKLFGHLWKAGPYTEFTYPKTLTLEKTALILQKGDSYTIRIDGGWGEYSLSCYPTDVVSAEIETSGMSFRRFKNIGKYSLD